MTIARHLLLFLLSAFVIWFFAGLLIESVGRVARRFHRSGFTVAFFVLGLLTSISEISVMVNATWNGVPQVSAGNLVGASFVIFLLIVPLLAIVGNGVKLKNTLRTSHLAAALGVIILPAVFVLDGVVTVSEGIGCLISYCALIFLIARHTGSIVPKALEEIADDLTEKRKATAGDALKIIIGAGCIFLAGHLLVEEAVYFSAIVGVPDSFIGLILLSLGTNVPELVIAARSILNKRNDIAFGDYIGSAVTNTPIFGLLGVVNGDFIVESSEFIFTTLLMACGFAVFLVFSRSKNKISRGEGFGLISFYAIFLIIQFINFLRFTR